MISVCMASFNGEKFIRNQVESILKQLSDTDELIISDDGSTDDTIKIIKAFNDNRIKLICHRAEKELISSFYGQYTIIARNFENAISQAKGDYILLSDQDDIWDENRSIKVINNLQTNILVMCNYKVLDSNGHVFSQPAYKRSPICNNWIINLCISRFMTCCIGFRKELLPYILPFHEKIISCDQWIGCIASKYGKVKFLDDVYHLYRRHGNNVSPTSGKSKNPLSVKIRFRYEMLKILIVHFKNIKKNQF